MRESKKKFLIILERIAHADCAKHGYEDRPIPDPGRWLALWRDSNRLESGGRILREYVMDLFFRDAQRSGNVFFLPDMASYPPPHSPPKGPAEIIDFGKYKRKRRAEVRSC